MGSPITVLSDDLRVESADALTVRLEALTPECNAYATILRLTAVVREPKRGGRQVCVVPFSHAAPQVGAQHLMLLDVVGHDSIFQSVGGTKTDANAPAAVQLAPNFDALVQSVQWSDYSIAGDFESRLKRLKARYGEKHGFAVVTPGGTLKDGNITCVVGWVWYGRCAVAPCDASGATWIAGDRTAYATCQGVRCPGGAGPATTVLPQLLNLCSMYHQETPEARKRLAVPAQALDVYRVTGVAGLLRAERDLAAPAAPQPGPTVATPRSRAGRWWWQRWRSPPASRA